VNSTHRNRRRTGRMRGPCTKILAKQEAPFASGRHATARPARLCRLGRAARSFSGTPGGAGPRFPRADLDGPCGADDEDPPAPSSTSAIASAMVVPARHSPAQHRRHFPRVVPCRGPKIRKGAERDPSSPASRERTALAISNAQRFPGAARTSWKERDEFISIRGPHELRTPAHAAPPSACRASSARRPAETSKPRFTQKVEASFARRASL